MAGKENPRKRKLNANAETNQIDEKHSKLGLPNRSKLLKFVSSGQINHVIDILKVIPTNSKSFNAAFFKATELGHKRMVQKFIETGASVNAKNILGNTPLHIACMHGFVDLVKLFIRNGSEVDCQNKNGQTALMLAVEKSCSLPLLEYLTSDECCANVNIQDPEGRTALMVAINLQDFCAMKFLMAHKDTKLELKDVSGKTAIDIAKENGLGELFTTFKACFRTNISVSPLVMALKKNSVPLVKSVLYTLSPEDVNTLGANSFSPLMIYLNNKFGNIRPTIVKRLLDAGAKVNIASPKYNMTPLLLACRSGSLDAVKLLVAKGADVNIQTKRKKMTPLMFACENFPDETEMVEFLLKHNADISLTNSDGETALIVALRCNNQSCAEELIKHGAEVNEVVVYMVNKAGWLRKLQKVDLAISKDMLNKTLLVACMENNYELAKFLLEHGAEVNQFGDNVPITLAQPYAELSKLLLSFGADVNFQKNAFAVIEAVIQDNIFALENLIKQGAFLNASTRKYNLGYTALMIAAENEKLNIMNILLDAGADINFVSAYGDKTALNAALTGRKIEALKLLLQRGALVNHKFYSPLVQSLSRNKEEVFLELLLNKGADPNIELPDGSTVLMTAFEMRCEESKINLLLNFGANPNTKSYDGESPITIAAKHYSTTLIESLLKSGADINAKDRHGRTALLWALEYSEREDKIAFLINNGADVNQSSHGGNCPLVEATRHYSLNILRLLLDKGADVNAHDEVGRTCLMHTVTFENSEKFNFFIERKANLDIKCQSGVTAAILAASLCRTSKLEALIKAGANMNLPGVDTLGRSVLTAPVYFITNNTSTRPIVSFEDSQACLKLVLSAGAKLDLRNKNIALFFHKIIILFDDYELIYSFMKTGTAPPVVSVKNLRSIFHFPSHHYYATCEKEKRVTPLLTAVFSKKTELALLFLKHWYLDKDDIIFLSENILDNQPYLGHLPEDAFLGVTRKPLSLKCLSFVAVSTAVGNLPDRESRVNSLPVPSIIKSSLLFQIQGLHHHVKAPE